MKKQCSETLLTLVVEHNESTDKKKHPLMTNTILVNPLLLIVGQKFNR